MWKKSLVCLTLSWMSIVVVAQYPKTPDSLRTPFERGRGMETATHAEGMAFYEHLTRCFPKFLRWETRGATDCGIPLNLLVVADDAVKASPQYAQRKNKSIGLILNGIHAGEPDGIDASMLFVRDLMLDTMLRKRVLNEMILLIVPFYNVDGMLNRGESRANQNGPVRYGFRGNAKNLDLNRDFIKADTKNTRSFLQIYNQWQPHLFLDTHVSNGADYPYTMTLLATQSDKLHPYLRDYQQDTLLPKLYADMKKRGQEMSPYVHFNETPRKGLAGFLDLPRYSTGFAALHHSWGFMSETHMLKPFQERVQATRALMHSLVAFGSEHSKELQGIRRNAIIDVAHQQQDFPLQWMPDTARRTSLMFKGFEEKYRKSEVTGLPQLWYDRKAPYQENLPYFPHFRPTLSVRKPSMYLLPRAYAEVAERLQINGVRMELLEQDDSMEVTMYYIRDFKTVKEPYEGHYLHFQVQVEAVRTRRFFRKGDYKIRLNQPENRLIVELLEPQGADSFFAWNFFDAVLQQKEGYSDYVFEPLAAQLLKKNPNLRKDLEEKRKNDPAFAQSAEAQLDFIYKNSSYYETHHRLYPVARVE